jgi:hypothetical protein
VRIGLNRFSTNSSLLFFLSVRGVSGMSGVELVLGCGWCLCDSVRVLISRLMGFMCLLRLPRSVRVKSVAAGSVQLPGGRGGSFGSGVVGLVDEELYSSVLYLGV